MERVGFTMRLLPGQEAEYRRRHAAVWPEMLDALARPARATTRSSSTATRPVRLSRGRRLRRRSAATMAAAPVNDRWQAEMASLIDPLTDPSTGFHQRLEEIFHLD